MNKKEFSIIVLHYGDQNNLFNLLDCLKNQNNNSFELCVINNDKPIFLKEKIIMITKLSIQIII